MFVYLIDDITRNLLSTSVTQAGTRLYTEGLSSAKLLPHYGVSSTDFHTINVVNVNWVVTVAKGNTKRTF